jgi:hypothetical protein
VQKLDRPGLEVFLRLLVVGIAMGIVVETIVHLRKKPRKTSSLSSTTLTMIAQTMVSTVRILLSSMGRKKVD